MVDSSTLIWGLTPYEISIALLGFFGGYYILANTVQLYLVFVSYRSIKRRIKFRNFDLPQDQAPKVSFIIPAYNEEPVISSGIDSAVSLNYSNFELIIVDDGSKDFTAKKVIDRYGLRPLHCERYSRLSKNVPYEIWGRPTFPRITLLRQTNTGKAGAINLGLDYANAALVAVADADTLYEKKSLATMVSVLIKHPETIGIGGTVRILNGSKVDSDYHVRGKLPNQALLLFQVTEYIRAFFLGRVAWDHLGGTVLLSGAYSMFRKEALIQVGGFDVQSITEDFDIVLKLYHQFPSKAAGKARIKRFRLLAEPMCWTQAPASLEHLKKQRDRWYRGLWHTLIKHRGLFLKSRFGSVGMGSLPYLLLYEGLSPVFEVGAYFALAFHFYVDPHTGHHPIFYYLICGGVFSWLTGLIGIHFEQAYYARNRTSVSWVERMIEVAKFLGITFVEMVVFHPILTLWKLRTLCVLPFTRDQWGIKPREKVDIDDRKAA